MTKYKDNFSTSARLAATSNNRNKRLLRRRAVVHAHFVEDEEEGVVGGLLIIRKSRGARCNICVELCTFVDKGVNRSTFYALF